MFNPFIIGKYVYLRPVEEENATVIQRWHNDPDIRKLSRCGGLPVSCTSEEEDIKDARTAGEVYLLIVQRATNKPLGFIRSKVIDMPARNVWLRFAMGSKATWGRGYAREALMLFLDWLFSEQNMHKVTLETYATNERALTFFKKLGFKREGVLRQAVYINGTYHDIISLGLLKHEFKSTPPH